MINKMDMVNNCNCKGILPPEPVGCVFNHPVVVCCLIWAVVVLVLSILVYCLLKRKDKTKKEIAEKQRVHELGLKEKAFEQEKYWAFFNRMEKLVEEELKKAQKELEELKKKEKDLVDGKSKLEKDKEVFEKQILEEKIRVYQEIIKNK